MNYTVDNQTIQQQFDISGNETSSILVGTKTIESLGVSLSTTVSANDSNVQIGFAKSDDLTAYCAEVCNYKVSESLESSFNLDKVDISDNYVDSEVNNEVGQHGNISVNADIFVASASNSQKASIDWVKPNNSLYSELIIVSPIDNKEKDDNNKQVAISYTVKRETSIQFLFPLLVLSILFLGSAIIVYIHRRNKNRSGKHGGSSAPMNKKKFKSADIFLPKSEQILNVREFSNKHNHSTDSQINVAAQINFFNSNINNNNYSSQLNTDSLIDITDSFNATSELNTADANSPDFLALGKTRKELRDIVDTSSENNGNIGGQNG